jgi:hypothetical protein
MIMSKLKISISIHSIIIFSLILWLSWYFSYDLSELNNLLFVIPFGVYLILYVISFFEKFKNIKISLISVSLIFLFLEVLSQIGVSIGWLNTERFSSVKQFYMSPFPQFNQVHAKFNRNIGFEWSQQQATVFKYAGEKLIFKNTFKGNNYGFHSSIDFTPQKLLNVKRWIVFGDSFTDGYFLQTTWVDKMNEMYRKDSVPIEFYSFSVNGGGVRNWNQIFHQIVDSNFEFDGVVFAVFGNDLMRDFFVLHQDKKQELYKYYDYIPSQKEVDFDLKNSLNSNLDYIHLFKKKVIYTSRICNFILRKLLNKKYRDFYKNEQSGLQNEFIMSNDTVEISEEYLEKKYKKNFALFMAFINTLKIQNKQVALLSIPELDGLNMNVNGQLTQIQKELIWIANQQKLGFIDGYQLMINSKIKSLDSFYFKNDGHWNQLGSNEFALQFYKKNHSLLN